MVRGITQHFIIREGMPYKVTKQMIWAGCSLRGKNYQMYDEIK